MYAIRSYYDFQLLHLTVPEKNEYSNADAIIYELPKPLHKILKLIPYIFPLFYFLLLLSEFLFLFPTAEIGINYARSL